MHDVESMKSEYDFSHGERGLIVPVPSGQTRITLRLDDDITEWFKAQVEAAGGGSYQELINDALRQHIRQGAG